MKIITSVAIKELHEMAERMYGGLVKAAVDVVKHVVIIDMEMHADGEAKLLELGSKQSDLWGINLYPAKFGSEDFIEFDSMINLKPHQNNLTRSVNNPAIQELIKNIISKVVHE